MDLPIACTLTEAQLRERRQAVMNLFRSAQASISELPEGYAFTLPASSETLHRLAQVVDLERECCSFLTFKIVVEAAQGSMRLEVTGPIEAKKLIVDYFSPTTAGE
jgi:hypothetical protein